MKKIFIFIILNIFIIFVSLIIIEFFCAYRNFVSFKNFHISVEERNNYTFLAHILNRYKINTYYGKNFRQPSGLNYLNKKPSIILIGCSYTYGSNLDETETFSYQLSKYTKRPVYNLGIPGGGPREILHLLRTNYYNNFNIDPNNVDYVIYTYIGDHRTRLYSNLRPVVPKFKLTNDNRLIENKKHSFFEKTFAYQQLTKLKFFYFDEKHSFNLFSIYLNEINREIMKNFKYKKKSAKFIILVYRSNEYENNLWDNFKDENITIIKVKDLIGEDIANDPEYRTFDDHPNKKAWEIIIPELVKKLNL